MYFVTQRLKVTRNQLGTSSDASPTTSDGFSFAIAGDNENHPKIVRTLEARSKAHFVKLQSKKGELPARKKWLIGVRETIESSVGILEGTFVSACLPCRVFPLFGGCQCKNHSTLF